MKSIKNKRMFGILLVSGCVSIVGTLLPIEAIGVLLMVAGVFGMGVTFALSATSRGE